MTSRPAQTGQQGPFLPFPDAPPAVRLSETSRSAAGEIRRVTRSLRETVLRWFIARGTHGGTDSELETALAIPGNTVRPRRVELCRLGLLVDSGRRRPTSSGRRAVVWQVNTLNTPEGMP